MTPSFHPGTPSKVYLVEERPNPSTAYYILPYISANNYPVISCNFSEIPLPSSLEGAMVIFIRYIPSAWANLVSRTRSRLHSLVYFMDDDVLDFSATSGMPLRYRYKLLRFAAMRRQWLHRQSAQIWVSSKYLHQKYSEFNPRLVLPSYLSPPTGIRRLFYHGSASHDAEIRWLLPVIREVLQRDESLVFEVIGGMEVYRLYRGMQRVTVVHPMKWPAYQAFLSTQTMHIGLAPLLDIPFNHGRSYTKFFDITRCGAVGIYSPGSIYSEVINHRHEGMIVELDQSKWVDAILELASNEVLRLDMLNHARSKSAELTALANRGYQDLLLQAHQD